MDKFPTHQIIFFLEFLKAKIYSEGIFGYRMQNKRLFGIVTNNDIRVVTLNSGSL